MKPKLSLEKIDALTPRERVILFFLLLAAIWAVADALLLGPQDKARRSEKEKMDAAVERIAQAETALAGRTPASDPASAALAHRDGIRRALDESRKQLAASRLITARDMVQVLQGMLKNQPGLRLVSLDSLAPEPLPAGARPEDAALYRQGVRITLAGHYGDLVLYMENLEKQAQGGFYWSRAEMDASHSPGIELTLTLYTLSEERTWLTV